jgi:hypothetical protein
MDAGYLLSTVRRIGVTAYRRGGVMAYGRSYEVGSRIRLGLREPMGPDGTNETDALVPCVP